jgi:hypothetical protein
MNVKILSRTLLFIITSTLIGCAHLNSNFDCPMKPGIQCESIDEINARVDCGQFDGTCKKC